MSLRKKYFARKSHGLDFDYENTLIELVQDKVAEISQELGEYRQIDDIILEFHNEFYTFESREIKIYQRLSAIAFVLLVFIFCVLGFSTIALMSSETILIFGFYLIDYNLLILLITNFISCLVALLVLTIMFSIKKDRLIQEYYYCAFKKHRIDRGYCFSIKEVDSFYKLPLGGFINLWVKSVFNPKDISYTIETLYTYTKYKDDFSQSFTLTSFLSNPFIKGFISVIFVGGLGFIGAYYANILSENSEKSLINTDVFFLIFYVFIFLVLFYYTFVILKEVVSDFIDLFVPNSKVTMVRKKRLAYQLQQSRVLKINKVEEVLYNSERKR